MKELKITYRSKDNEAEIYECRSYDYSDLPQILDIFFFWKVSALLADTTGDKKPQFPESFSEKFCCFVCGLAHKPGDGPDAFKVGSNKKVRKIEIKATTTATGLTSIKRDCNFDDLYWVSFVDYNSLKYVIYKFTRTQIMKLVDVPKVKNNIATVNLMKYAQDLKLEPAHKGRIGIVKAP